MVHTVQTEIERKFAVDEAAVLPELNGVGGGVGSVVVAVRTEEPVQLEAVYYDTAEVALARNRIALRRREGGHDGGWHVKLPAEEGRTELQWPLDVDSAPHAPENGGSDDPASPSPSTSSPSTSVPSTSVPSIVVDTVRVHVRDRPLTPLAQLQTTRTVTNLLDASGAVVVELSDDTVRATDAREGTVRLWREWEAELGPAAPDTVEGRTALLDELGERLLAAGATVSPSLSKLAQALGRSGLDEPAGDGGTPSDPVASTLRAGVTELVERMIALDPAVRTDEFDAVHRFRTTVRRLRTALAPAPELRESLSMLGSVLGEVRDLEVQAERAEFALDELESERGIADKDAQRRLVEQTLDERAAAHERLVAFLSAPRYYRLLDALEDFVADVPAAEASSSPSQPSASGKQASGKGAQKAAQKSARKAGRKAARKAAGKAVQKAGRRALRRSVPASVAQQALADDIVEASRATGALHSSRKAARRLRYVAEFSSEGAAAVLGGGIDEVADAAEELQDALGWHRDAALFAEFVLLTARRAEAEGESGFTYGVLYQRAIDQSRRALDLAADARRTLKRTL